MKNVFKTFLAMIAVCSVIFVGCASEEGSSSSVNYDVSGSGSVPVFEANNIIKNKVVNLNGSADVYYEYLAFTSEDGGAYSVYKDVDGVLTKQESITVGDFVIDFPSEFTFEKETGKVTVGTSSSYMIDAKKSDKKVFAVAGEILTTSSENKATLINEWVSIAGDSFDFKADGTVTFVDNKGAVFSLSYSNKSGWILIDDVIPFYWTKMDGSYNLYYPIYETVRETVSEVGRAAVESGLIELTSNNFLFVR